VRSFEGLGNVGGKHVAVIELDRDASGCAARKPFDANNNPIADHLDILSERSDTFDPSNASISA
jgi:hypothetical protein